MIEIEHPTGGNVEAWAYRLLCASAFGVTFSLPVGRTFLVLSLVCLLIHLVKERQRPRFPAVAWFALLFSSLAATVTVFGVNPQIGIGKLDKLAWFVAIPVAATLVTSRARAAGLLGAFAAGTGFLSLEIMTWRVLVAARAAGASLSGGGEVSFFRALTDLGSMTDGQTLTLGVVVAVGLACSRSAEKRRSGWLWGLLVLQCLALVTNLKRGSWACTLLVVGGFVAARMSRRALLLLFALAVLIFALPPVRGRFADLRQEFDVERGGRLTMWTRIAPALIREHPWGIGYRSLTPELMQSVAEKEGVHVEPDRNHLHSNPVQVLVATGWLGLLIYAAWMLRSLYDGISSVRCEAARAPPDRALALVPLLMLVALLLNGLLEYNFADGELVLVYGMIMGTMARGRASS